MVSNRLAILIPLYNPGRLLYDVLSNLEMCAATLGEYVDIFLADDSVNCFPDISSIVGVKKWGSVTYWKNQINFGECGNVNNAFKKIKNLGYEFAMLLHQDDLVTSRWLHFCIARVRNKNDAHGQLWFCECECVKDDEVAVKLNEAEFINAPVTRSLNFSSYRGMPAIEAFYRDYGWGPSGTLFHLESFFAIGGFYSLLKYCADGDFGVRWFINGFSMNMTSDAIYYRRMHLNQTTQVGVYSGIADQGYAYIMVQYRSLAGLRRRVREHVAWARRKIGLAWRAIKGRRFSVALAQFFALRIVFASLFTCVVPGLAWLLPISVQELLKNAPNVRGLISRP